MIHPVLFRELPQRSIYPSGAQPETDLVPRCVYMYPDGTKIHEERKLPAWLNRFYSQHKCR